MAIKVIKGSFEFEIDNEFLEDYLLDRKYKIDNTNQLYVFPTDYEVVYVDRGFSLLLTFFGIFVNYLDEGIFISLYKIVESLTKRKKLIIRWEKKKKIKYIWLKYVNYGLNFDMKKINFTKYRKKLVKIARKHEKEIRKKYYESL